jgi:hypothetical protein
MRLLVAAAALLVLARPGPAHIVPIPPSVCAFDPLALQVPAMGLAATADDGGATDAMRFVYDSSASLIQVCPASPADPATTCGAVTPRTFTLGATAGSLAFPSLFSGGMVAGGDVAFADLPVTLTLGAAGATVPVTFTTGLVAVGGTVFEGTPLQGLESIGLVGVASGDALPPPLTGQSLLLSITCLPRPVPDKDQFVQPPLVAPIRGQVTAAKASLHAVVTLPSAATPDFGGRPTLVALHADGTTIATALLSHGLAGRHRLKGTSDDGHATVTLRQASPTRLVVGVQLRGVALPTEPAGARVLVDLTLDTGGLLARGVQLFHGNRSGRRLHS